MTFSRRRSSSPALRRPPSALVRRGPLACTRMRAGGGATISTILHSRPNKPAAHISPAPGPAPVPPLPHLHMPPRGPHDLHTLALPCVAAPPICLHIPVSRAADAAILEGSARGPEDLPLKASKLGQYPLPPPPPAPPPPLSTFPSCQSVPSVPMHIVFRVHHTLPRSWADLAYPEGGLVALLLAVAPPLHPLLEPLAASRGEGGSERAS